MRAIILAAGRGSRMGELTDDKPKCLLEYRGRTLLDWQLAAIREVGVKNVAIVTGYRRELIAPRAPTEFYNPRWADTNMVRSLQAAAAWLEAGVCLVCYADLFYDAAALHGLVRASTPLAIAYDPGWLKLWQKRFENPLDDAETFRLAPDGTLAEIGGRPGGIEEVEGQYMGLLRIAPAGWAEMKRQVEILSPPEADRLQMTHLLQQIVREGTLPINAIPFRGMWAEYDSPSDIVSEACATDGLD